MLALEAENDSEEEFERIMALAELTFDDILLKTGAKSSMAKNAVKILPGVAQQLGDILRKGNNSFPIHQISITEEEIDVDSTNPDENNKRAEKVAFRPISASDIAKAPDSKDILAIPIDLASANKIRQERYALHQKIVRLLAMIHEEAGFKLYEGKFDCLAVKEPLVLLYEVKTLIGNGSDEEKQSVRGVGQLKFYQFSIVMQQMGLSNARQFLVFSRKPSQGIIDFCSFERIGVIWVKKQFFWRADPASGEAVIFDPSQIV